MGRGWAGVREQRKQVQVLVPGDVSRCLDELGVEIIRVQGEEATGRCPGHYARTGKEDAHPSWSVNTETGFHNCFACGFRGSFSTLVKEILDCTWDEANAWVKARGTLDRIERELLGQYIHELAEDEAEQITEADLALYTEVPEWACDDRNLDPGSVDHFGVLWDEGRQMWIIPIRDPETGRLWGWQEKGQEKRIFRNHPEHLTKSKTLFGLQQFEGDTAVLVESPLDVVRLDTAGVPGGLAIMGRTVSEAQFDILRDRCTHLICALDNDSDGVEASDELRERARGKFRLTYFDYSVAPKAKDPGDMTNQQIQRAVRQAFPSVMWSRKC